VINIEDLIISALKSQGVLGVLLAVIAWQNYVFFNRVMEMITMCRDCKYRIGGEEK